MPTFDPPLLGDGHGNYRIHLVGNSGTGKSTLGAYLAGKLNIPHISLDEIAWKPGWERIPADEFRERIRTLVVENARGWVIDGDYGSALGTLVADNATDIVWLDPPLYRYLPRLVWRTFMRLLGITPTCARGCEESWREAFSSDSIIWYCITNHGRSRTKYTAWLSCMNLEAGRRMIRLDEFAGELAAWKSDLERHIRQM